MNISVELSVSRETKERLRAFAALVEKWTVRINLISKASVSDIWDRHIVDSAQIFNLAPKSGRWVDLGSGGGFPGIVMAIMTKDLEKPHEVILVESDQRKSTFLRTAIRELNLDATVVSERIEEIGPFEADIISARALAELDDLLEFADRHMKSGGTALFPKGSKWEAEITAAREHWSYHCDPYPSVTNPSAAVLSIKDIHRV